MSDLTNMNATGVGAIILGAGMGTRMRSALPKVLHGVGGQPMVSQGVADQEVQAALQSQERLHIMDEEKYQRTIKDLQQQLANGGKIIRTSDKDLAKMNSRIDFDYQTERVPAYELFAPEETIAEPMPCFANPLEEDLITTVPADPPIVKESNCAPLFAPAP